MQISKGEGRKTRKGERRIKDALERPGEEREGERLLTSHVFFRSASYFLPCPSRAFCASRAPEIRFAFPFKRLPSRLK